MKCSDGFCSCNIQFTESKRVKSANDLKSKLKSADGKLVILFFYKLEECRDCGKVEDLAFEYRYKNVVFLKIDVDKLGDVKKQYEVDVPRDFIFVRRATEISDGRFKEVSLVEAKIKQIKLEESSN